MVNEEQVIQDWVRAYWHLFGVGVHNLPESVKKWPVEEQATCVRQMIVTAEKVGMIPSYDWIIEQLETQPQEGFKRADEQKERPWEGAVRSAPPKGPRDNPPATQKQLDAILKWRQNDHYNKVANNFLAAHDSTKDEQLTIIEASELMDIFGNESKAHRAKKEAN